MIHQCCGILGLLCSGIILCSCVTDEYKSSAPPLSDQSLKRLQEIAENEMQRGNTLSLRFHATLNVIGQLPYDKSTLPVVSPTGEFIATSVGIAPEKSTLLAQPGSPSPLATGVEIWKLNKSKGTFESVFNLDPPLLLGRSADAEGFLIESPSPEGARRIGKVAWETGELTWLVADGRVNAFATIGPDGQLAWSSREVNQSGFTLVVRNNQGRELEIGPQRWKLVLSNMEHSEQPTVRLLAFTEYGHEGRQHADHLLKSDVGLNDSAQYWRERITGNTAPYSRNPIRHSGSPRTAA